MVRTFGAFLGLFLLLTATLGCRGGAQRTIAPGDLWVISSPTGQVDGPLRIVVVFSKPMVEKRDLGPTESPPLKIQPKVSGVAEWTDEKTLVFVASETLPSATEFTASIPDGVVSLSGHRLTGDHTFVFSTARLNGNARVAGSEKFGLPNQRIDLEFNHRVAFGQVAEHCQFKSGTESRGVKLEGDPGPAKKLSVVPQGPLTLDAAWTFECKSALRGSEGSLGLRKKLSKQFRTYGKLKFARSNVTGEVIIPDERNRISLEFSTPLEEPYQLAISPKVRGFPERCYSMGEDRPGVSCSVTLEPKTNYTVTALATQKDRFKQALGESATVSFSTGDAPPAVSLESGYFVAELGRPVLPVWARNAKTLNITATEINPQNFAAIRKNIYWWDNNALKTEKLKGVKNLKRIATSRNIAGQENKWAQYPIDPAALLGRKPGPGMYYVEVGTPDVDEWPYRKGGKQKVLVNFTDLGVVTKISSAGGLVWVTSLATGKALSGARVTARTADGKRVWSGRTSRDGIAKLPAISSLLKPNRERRSGALNIFVSRGADFTMVNAKQAGGLASWNFNISSDSRTARERLRGFMHTDRGLYQPGEKVHVKGIARVSRLGSSLAVPTNKNVDVEIRGPRGKVVRTIKTNASAFGGFHFDLDLAGDARLGDYTITAKLAGGTFRRQFAVEEYRPSTFEVTGKSSSPSIVRRGKIEASVEAKYFYGAPLRSGKANITVHQRPRAVRFPEHPRFSFGDHRSDERYHDASSYSQELVTEDTIELDNQGRASIRIGVGPADMPKDADLLVNASVSSPSNEVINKRFTIPYFRSKRYFGIKAEKTFVETGKKQTLELISIDPNGKPITGPAKVSIERHDWNCVWEGWGYRGSYRCKSIKQPILSQKVTFTAGKSTPLSFSAPAGGEYWVVVSGGDDAQLASKRLYAWGASGGSWRSDDGMTFDIAVDKQEYRAGDTAELILKTDLSDATGLVTIERDGVIERRFVKVNAKSKKISIPVTAKHAPNVYVSVALVQGRKGKGVRGKPRMKMGMVNLAVRPEGNRLNVAVSTDETDYRPGGNITAKVKVTDSAGRPVSAEVSIVAADEGVLSLIGYKTPNPIPTFYAPWGLGVTTATQFAFIRDIPGPGRTRPATGGDGSPSALGTVRSRFMATAVWKPSVVTNRSGVATATFKAPDNLTAFRVMAVAADKGTRFGSGDKRFTVSKPVQLHRSLPRFVTLGDKLSGGVIVHNETTKAGTAVVRLASTAPLKLGESAVRRVTVPAGGRVPVLWNLSAAAVGKAELTFSVALGADKDAVKFELPVHHPSPEKRSFVKAGATKVGEQIALSLPASAIPSSATVHVSVDPNGLAGIEEGLRDLVGYPYGCLEQTTSKVIPMIAVRGLIEALNLDGLSGNKIDEYVTEGIAKIGRHQTVYGGFSLWPGGDADRYYTAYALWGLHLAKKAGYKVDQSRIDDGLRYLKKPIAEKSADYYSRRGALANQAFSLYLRAMLGDKDTSKATELLAKKDELPIYGKAFLTRALAAGLGANDPAVVGLLSELAQLADDASKKGTLISESKEKDLYYYMSSSTRTTAIVLETLVALEPKSPAIVPLVMTLMKKRRTTPYHSTQSNIYSLLALNEYAESVPPTGSKVEVSIGGRQMIDTTLAGKSRLKLASSPLAGARNLAIKSNGQVHYNVEIRYLEKPSTLVAQSNGMTIKREYLDPKGNAKKAYKVGDIVRVRLTMTGTRGAPHLMLSDRLPAGFEALNTRFATTAAAGNKPKENYWGGTREIRSHRVDFATEYNWSDTYVREYQMRAIAVGEFAIPPAVSEQMYEPSVNARTGQGSLVIKK